LYGMKKSLRRFLEAFPLFIFMLPLFFCLHTFNYYFGLTRIASHFPAILIYLLWPFCILVILRLYLKSSKKAAVFLFFLMLLFYPFQFVHDSLTRIVPWLGRYLALFPTILLLQILLIGLIARSKSTFTRFFLASNTIFIILVLTELVGFGARLFSASRNSNFLVDKNVDLRNHYMTCDTCRKPDIYFIIFDEYTNSKTLLKEFNFENGWFEQNLKTRGFRTMNDA